jgi:hypothetical protein
MQLGRVRLYEMFYALKSFYKDRIKLLFCDTDSNAFELQVNEGEDVLKDLANIEIAPGELLLDLSNAPIALQRKDLNYIDLKGKPGRAKMETWNVIEELCVMRKKAYAIKLRDQDKDIMKMKGCPSSYLKDCSIETYKETLFNSKMKPINICMMRSLKLQLFNITMKRMTFSPISSDRFLLPPNGVESKAFGHYTIIDGEHASVFEEGEVETGKD